ncbi:phosphoribosyl-AMP cyclohydrolase [Hyphomicrobium methylovorum]|uniref:phosphoribosyl-AMP cyclohydrolase n=1 Tax=Hyphomicrobium methylovorum TaxID=84 RepID=UPI0015E69306|nr:phosphoribosyl-AMP cyclohydrolase [Hyphomicrobium methylovorum]MBA2124796.1 phosphoribosyl-AMP cyclohydrolase [Hyphomicrobium methylovorum]
MSDNATAPTHGDDTIEATLDFKPRFDRDGLIAAIATDQKTGAVLMFAHMNAEALRLTLESGVAHFWSRSRAKLWKKGEESGNVLRVAEVRTDCDQDVLWLTVTVEGNGVACHTGAASCFYRRVVPTAGKPSGAVLERSDIARPSKIR